MAGRVSTIGSQGADPDRPVEAPRAGGIARSVAFSGPG